MDRDRWIVGLMDKCIDAYIDGWKIDG